MNKSKLRAILTDVMSLALLGLALVALFSETGYFGVRIRNWKQDRLTRDVAAERQNEIRTAATHLGLTTERKFIIEVGDYECPFCRINHPTVDTLLSSGVAVQFLHYPLPSHKHASQAALLAICSERANAVENMHRLLMISVDWATTPNWDEISRDGGVPQSAVLEACLGGGDAARRLQQNIELAKALGVNGTPTYIGPSGVVRGVATVKQLMSIAGAQ